MFCSRCGTEVEQGIPACPTCGLDLRPATPTDAAAASGMSDGDMIREALSQEYEIIEELGRGGMAMVFRARERQLDREVAIKVLPFSLSFDAEFVERFTREARTSAQLEHPNIIQVYGVGKSGRVIYFVMKMLRGGALSTALAERGKLPPAEIRRLLTDVGSALGYAHARGIVHRDIKPDNIMFDEFGQCVVTDFGIAKAGSSTRLTGTGMSIGTPHYMSPEQARAQSIDGRSDLYSLGVVAYQALVGQVPYDGEDSFAIGVKHIMEPIPVPLLDTVEERRLFEIVKRLLMKDPYDRYQNAEELLKALESPAQTPFAGGRRLSAAQTMLVNQATTPLPAASVPLAARGRAAPPAGTISPPARPAATVSGSSAAVPSQDPRRAAPRRVAAAEAPKAGWVPWLFLLFLFGGFGAGGWYLYQQGALGGPREVAQDAVPSDAEASMPTPPGGESLAAVVAAPAETVVAIPGMSDTGGETGGLATGGEESPVRRAPNPGDSGTLMLLELPPGSRVTIDDNPVTQIGAGIRLPAGVHDIGISAPQHDFYRDTLLTVGTDQIVPYAPYLQRIGRPKMVSEPPRRRALAALGCDQAGTERNRFGRLCYDVAPRLRSSDRVQVPAGAGAAPTPAIMLVRVSREGRTLRVETRRPSSDSLFTAAVVEHVRRARWEPARLEGAEVAGWTLARFSPEEAP